MVTEWPAYDVERTSVRVVLRDVDGRVLLFQTIDPTMPEVGEETGFALAAREVSLPTWRRDSTYVRRHVRTWQHELVVSAQVPGAAPVPAPDGRTPEELDEYVGHRWWTVAEIAGSRERFFPGRLPDLLEAFLDGREIDEPFDLWN